MPIDTDTKATKPVKAQASSQAQPKKKQSAFRRSWRRYIWPVLRHLVIPFVCLAVMIAGMAVGYAVIGDKPLSEVWEWGTWQHMYDLIFA